MLVARRADRLEELRAELEAKSPSLTVNVAACDLADEARTRAMLDWVSERIGAVNVLVNNAGIGDQSLYDRADWTRIRRMIQVNVVALAMLTRRLVPPMVERGRGSLLDPRRLRGDKAFRGRTETLRSELADTGVVVTQVCPRPGRTRSRPGRGHGGRAARFLAISAERCAREEIRGLDRGDALVFPGFPHKPMMPLLGLVPRSLQRRAARSAARRLRDTPPRSRVRTPREEPTS